MFIKKIALISTFGFLSISASIASAGTVNYQYGDLLSGSFVPSSVFANLSVSTVDNITYDFVLTTNNLNTIFTTGAFIGSVAVDTTFANQEALPSVALTGTGNGVAEIDTSNGGGPTGVYDFRYVFGQGQDRLEANEVVSFTSTFAIEHTFDAGLFALHVQGLTDDQGGSAWYTPSPVPVPAALPLMAFALGAFGISRRLNKSKKA